MIPISPAARSGAVRRPAAAPQPVVTGAQYHVVRRGDSLWGIAQRYGVGVNDLTRWNRMERNDVLRVGQRLVVAPSAGSD